MTITGIQAKIIAALVFLLLIGANIAYIGHLRSSLKLCQASKLNLEASVKTQNEAIDKLKRDQAASEKASAKKVAQAAAAQSEAERSHAEIMKLKGSCDTILKEFNR